MSKPATNPAPLDPDDDPEVQRELAEERETKYGGRDRWFLTVVFFVCLLCGWWTAHEKQPLALLFAFCALVIGVMAIANWRSWLKKSPAQRAAVPSGNPFGNLEIKAVAPPYTRDEFLELRKTFGRNLAITALAGMYLVIGLIGAVVPRGPWMLRLIFVGGGVLALFIVRRPAQRVWLAFKSANMCPGCRDTLTSQTSHILQTGHCRKCGTQIISDTPKTPEVEPAAKETVTRPRWSSRMPSNFQHDPKRFLDIVTLFAVPLVCLFLFNGHRFDLGMVILIGVMACLVGGTFYFFPDSILLGEDSDEGSGRSAAEKPNKSASANSPASSAERLPATDFVLLYVPIVVVLAFLLYLVWIHHLLTKWQLAVATFVIPATMILESFLVARHVKKIGKQATGHFTWMVVGVWVVAFFIFVVCVVSWIQKFGLKW